MNKTDFILFSGAAPGAEAEFGASAERHGIEEVNFTFDGHTEARRRGIRVLNHEELQAGDVSLEYVSKLMNRPYTDSPTIRKILQTLWYQVNHGQEIYVIGVILEDKTVRGGTGWGAEFAKLCNKPLFVFDQDKDGWFEWTGRDWKSIGKDAPAITHPHFTGTGTRQVHDNGKRAIEDLFTRSFELGRFATRPYNHLRTAPARTRPRRLQKRKPDPAYTRVPSDPRAATARSTMLVPTSFARMPPPSEGCQVFVCSVRSQTRPVSTNATNPRRTGNTEVNTGGPK
jgi:ribosomal protein L20A (L18A)